MASEAALVERVCREFNRWPHTRAVKIHGGPFGRRGDPDIWGCCNGYFFALEAKMPGRKPTLSQLNELRRWGRARAVVGWFDTFELAIALVRPLLSKPPRVEASSRDRSSSALASEET